MKKSGLKKIEYLENDLREKLSIAVENLGSDESINRSKLFPNKSGKPGIKRIVENGLLFLFLFLLFSFQLPFLLIINIVIAFKALFIGIPFKPIPIVLPAKTVDLINNKIKIEIRHNEHAPPHYHVIIDDSDCAIDISTGEIIQGTLNSKKQKIIKEWHNKNKNVLIRTWNETRPSDCPVGKIRP